MTIKIKIKTQFLFSLYGVILYVIVRFQNLIILKKYLG